MSILCLDHAVWRDILLNWLGNLREIVHLDFAIERADIKNQFRDVFAQLAFPLPVTVRSSRDILVELFSWLKLRKVFLNHVAVTHFFEEWNRIFPWCKDSLAQLQIYGIRFENESSAKARYCKDTAKFMNLASIYCNRLRKLTIGKGNDRNVEVMRRILRNNSATLEILIVERMFGSSSVDCVDEIYCPRLRLLSWANSTWPGLGGFLGRCPNLVALSLNCGGAPEFLINALADNCPPTLRRLYLLNLDEKDNSNLVRIARGNRMLEYVGVFYCHFDLSKRVVDLFQALPHLQEFDTNERIAESVWLEIAMRGLAPSLRVLDTQTKFSRTGFSHFTEACPNLTGLKVDLASSEEFNENDNRAFFQHCGGLTHLLLQLYWTPLEVVDSLVESATLCCPDLEVLEFGISTQCNTWAVQNALDKCTKLKYLVNLRAWDGPPIIPPGVILTDNGPPLTRWS